MRKKLLFPISLAILIFAAVTFPQIADDGIGVTTTKLTDTIYKITCTTSFDANLLASVGPDGILLVDAGYISTADSLAAVLKTLGNGQIKYLINTHYHGDHTGGNRALADEAIIIAHQNVYDRMATPYYALPPRVTEGLPDILIDGSMTIYHNGEEVKLIHLPNAHTDGDIIVYFTGSNILHMNDILFSDWFPYVEVESGGDVENYRDHIASLIETLPSDIRLISSHGRDYTIDDLRKYHQMMTETIDIIRNGMNAGKSAQEMIDENVLKSYTSWEGLFVKSADWIRIVYNSFSQKTSPPVPSICEPLTYTILDQGVSAALDQYRQLKKSSFEKYNFTENELNRLGYELLLRSKIAEAIEIFKLNVEAFPEASNPYDSLGEGYLAAGDTTQAVVNYRKSLELNPDNTNAINVLQRLQNNE
jgi:cyclase